MKIAFITIGQSPRKDLYSDLGEVFKKLDYIEIGVLDNYSIETIEGEFGSEPGEEFYVTRLRNGSWIKVSVDKIISKIREVVRSIEESVDLIVLLCTGELDIYSKKPVIMLDKLLINLVKTINPHKLCIVFPERDQYDMVIRKWSSIVDNISCIHYNPYSEPVELLVDRARDLGECDLVVMDCIGYRILHGMIIKKYLGKPIILPRTLVLSIVKELSGVWVE